MAISKARWICAPLKGGDAGYGWIYGDRSWVGSWVCGRDGDRGRTGTVVVLMTMLSDGPVSAGYQAVAANEIVAVASSQLAQTTVDRVRLLLVFIAIVMTVLLILYIRHTSPRRHRGATNRRKKSVGTHARRKLRDSPAAADPIPSDYGGAVPSEEFIEPMLQRFRERAAAVKRRNLPPVGGEQRSAFIRQARLDYRDFAIIGGADAHIEDGVLIMRINLRPLDDETQDDAKTQPQDDETQDAKTRLASDGS